VHKGYVRSLIIWAIGFPCYILVGALLDWFKTEAFYLLRLVFFFMFVSVVSMLYYVNIKLREEKFGLETNVFWRWIERYIPFIFSFPIITFFSTLFIAGFTYIPDVAPFNYFINFCLGLFPYYILVFLNDLSLYLGVLREVWG